MNKQELNGLSELREIRLSMIKSGLLADGFKLGVVDIALTCNTEEDLLKAISLMNSAIEINLIITDNTPLNSKRQTYHLGSNF